jgi:UDP-3-O-[3-hydroxymyristoyl] glucosamine N-acyltransferase
MEGRGARRGAPPAQENTTFGDFLMPGWPESLETILARVAPDVGITRIANADRLADAQQTGFVWTRQPGVVCLAANRHYLALARGNPDACVIITNEETVQRDPGTGPCLVVCQRAEELYLYLHLHQTSAEASEAHNVDASAHVDPTAVMRGEVTIGEGAWIGPRAVINGPAVLGRGVHVEAGAVIGCEGLYAKNVLGQRFHIPHFGGVRVEDHAFIHAGAVIVRSAVRGESTRVGAGAHVGIMANVGHDSEIGERATVSSNVVIAGRARIGDDAWIGASATISNAVVVGERAKVRLGAVVVRDVAPGADVSSGNFALSHAQAMRAFTRVSRDENR